MDQSFEQSPEVLPEGQCQMKVAGEGVGWRGWVVKAVVTVNALGVLVMFRLPSSALPGGFIAPIDTWFIVSSVFICVVFLMNFVRKLRHSEMPNLGWASLVIDAVLVLGWWYALVYSILDLLLAGAAGVPN